MVPIALLLSPIICAVSIGRYLQEKALCRVSLDLALAPWLVDAPRWGAQVHVPSLQLDADQEATLVRILRLLRQKHRGIVKQFGSVSEHMAEILVAMQHDLALKTSMLATMDTMLNSCSDRVTRGMNDLHIALLTYRAEHSLNAVEELTRLGAQLARLEAVHQLAARRPATDAVERYLVLESHAAKEVDLPLWSSKVQFESFSGVGPPEAAEAVHVAKAVGPAEVQAFLQAWAPWQRHLRAQEVSTLSYDALPRTALPTDPGAICPILLEKAQDLARPVVSQDNRYVYDYDSLVRWYVELGTEPETRKPLAIVPGVR